MYNQSSTLHSDKQIFRNKYLNSDNRKKCIWLWKAIRGTNYPIFIYNQKKKKDKSHSAKMILSGRCQSL